MGFCEFVREALAARIGRGGRYPNKKRMADDLEMDPSQLNRFLSGERGLNAECSATYFLNSSTFRQLAMQQLSVAHALATGRMIIEGNGLPPPKLAAVMESVVASVDADNHPQMGALTPAVEPSGKSQSFSPRVSLRPR